MLSAMEKYVKDSKSGVWHDAEWPDDFKYTADADTENELLNLVLDSTDKSLFSTELSAGIHDWPSRYHLSATRANILRPVIDLINGATLEIGAGCGAITRFLGESGKAVVALESNFRRASVNAARCSDLPNVSVLCQSFENIDDSLKFDTIILVGGLEYSGVFLSGTEGRDQWDSMIALVHSHLNPSGKAIFAIENQLGLKYFAGYPEDHLGVAFAGLEDNYPENSVATFGRNELKRRLLRSFSKLRWLYPFPDYKFPMCVITEQGLETQGDFDIASLCASSVAVDAQRPATTVFSLERVWRPVQRNGLTADLANSFLVIASDEELAENEILAHHYGNGRKRNFNKVVQFVRTDLGIRCVRIPLNSDADREQGFLQIKFGEEDYAKGELWYDNLLKIINRPGWTVQHIAAWATTWWESVKAELVKIGIGENLKMFDHIPGDMMDAIPRNLIIGEMGPSFIDKEWALTHTMELGHLFYRGMRDALITASTCAKPNLVTVPLVIDQLVLDVGQSLGYWLSRADIGRYKEFEGRLQNAATGGIGRLPEVESEVLSVRNNIQNSNREPFDNVALIEKNEILDQETRNLAFTLELANAENARLEECLSAIRQKADQMRIENANLIHMLTSEIKKIDFETDRSRFKDSLIHIIKLNFSEEFYGKTYADVKASGIDLFEHYLKHGAQEHRVGNPKWLAEG